MPPLGVIEMDPGCPLQVGAAGKIAATNSEI